MSTVPAIALNNGVAIPQLGFGVFRIPPGEARTAVLAALEAGYRHIDTAAGYDNEREVGQALREGQVAREDVFVTTKLRTSRNRPDRVQEGFDQSLANLGLDYVDLYLIHWPLPKVGDFVGTWTALEEIYGTGRARAIGVSNFERGHLTRVIDEATIIPAVNQIEIHPFLPQDAARAFDREHGIATEAWAPLGRGPILGDPSIGAIARRLGRNPAQVILRWHLQRGDIAIPKSVRPDRMRENLGSLGFELADDDVAAITALGPARRLGPDPNEYSLEF